MAAPTLSSRDYKVACICPMGKELAAMRGMLDAIHQSPLTKPSSNAYSFGRIGPHNIALAVLPATGNNRAASTANQLINDLPALRFALLVGIGGGVPCEEVDIRLGDVVVGKANGSHAAVIQYDLGKVANRGEFKNTGFIKPPSRFLMAYVEQLQAQYLMIGTGIPRFIAEMLEKYPRMSTDYSYPGPDQDHLFDANYYHKTGRTCAACDLASVLPRSNRTDSNPKVHYGTIGSANIVVKDAGRRDTLAKDFGVICVEMEAAGLTDELDCLVIRGVSDYADSHKNDRWQPYAAATAAAYAKDFLLSIPTQETTNEAFNDRQSRNRYRVGSNISGAPNIDPAYFVGRHTELEQMNQILNPHRNVIQQRVVILGGLGGVGKTQLALEYARKQAADFDSIFWLNATSSDTLKAEMLSMSHRILHSSTANQELGDDILVDKFRAWLSENNNSNWLVIFDNYDEIELYDIKDYFPHLSQGSIIITTRSPETLNGTTIAIKAIKSKDESLAILEKRSGRSDLARNSDACHLVDRLGGLPLGLATAGAYLKRSTLTFREYLEEYDRNWPTLDKYSRHLPEYQGRTLFTTWNISFKQIQRQDTLAADLLIFLAYLDHSAVWFEFFSAASSLLDDMKPDWFSQIATNRLVFESAMNTLVDFCLVEMNTDRESYHLHRCVHDWVSFSLNRIVDPALFKLAVNCVCASIELHKSGNLPHDYRLLPYAEWLCSAKFEGIIEISDRPQILEIIAFLEDCGIKDLAIRTLEKFVQALTQCSLPDTELLRKAKTRLGCLYMKIYELDLAEKMLHQALTTADALPDKNFFTTLQIMQHLAQCFEWQRIFDKAEAIRLFVFNSLEAEYGYAHLDTLHAAKLLATTYKLNKQYVRAELVYRRVSLQELEILEHDDPNLLLTLVMLADVLLDQDRIDEAADCLEIPMTAGENRHRLRDNNLLHLAIIYARLVIKELLLEEFQLPQGSKKTVLRLLELVCSYEMSHESILNRLGHCFHKIRRLSQRRDGISLEPQDYQGGDPFSCFV